MAEQTSLLNLCKYRLWLCLIFHFFSYVKYIEVKSDDSSTKEIPLTGASSESGSVDDEDYYIDVDDGSGSGIELTTTPPYNRLTETTGYVTV